jgi:hypothetical protein
MQPPNNIAALSHSVSNLTVFWACQMRQGCSCGCRSYADPVQHSILAGLMGCVSVATLTTPAFVQVVQKCDKTSDMKRAGCMQPSSSSYCCTE